MPVVQCRGEIYQYVGDEVVLTWPVEDGIKQNNCLHCFFLVDAALSGRRTYFMERYGHAPSFKAGVHVGTATVGEIGVIKKDIVFSGDALNTTSTIQSECNNFGVRLLVSGELIRRLHLGPEFEGHPLGAIQLKGKAGPVELNSVRKTSGANAR